MCSVYTSICSLLLIICEWTQKLKKNDYWSLTSVENKVTEKHKENFLCGIEEEQHIIIKKSRVKKEKYKGNVILSVENTKARISQKNSKMN